MQKDVKKRPPIVAILGHVDHGKSSLLEAIKDLKITEVESGGITQHIGAYTVDHANEKITFIDTPGHEAFFAMRSRGAEVADIGILVVAADDGVKKQTKEAIKHLKDAKIPFLVVFNKMDKSEANPERVKQELSKEDVLVESYGGDIPSIEVSAIKKTGINELLEMITLLAELEDVTADYQKKAEGIVIETNIDSKQGIAATLLIKDGILKKGDIIGTDCCYGAIRDIRDFQGNQLQEALPSTPVRISGLKMNPHVGEACKVFDTKKEAMEAKINERGIVDFSENLTSKENALTLIIKTDFLGSLEAIKNTLEKLSRDKVGINVVGAGIGEVTEKDVELAKSCRAKIIAYRVPVSRLAKDLANQNKIDIFNYDIIYNLIEEVVEEMKKLLQKELVVEEIGEVEILAVFKTDKKRQVLGGRVKRGNIEKGAFVKIIRNKEEIGEGNLINLKRQEKDVDKIPEREEFGMLYEGVVRVEEKDTLVAYTKKEIFPDLS